MIQRAITIIEALAGGPVTQELMLRIADAYLPEGIDPLTATNEEKATYFVRGIRQQVKRQVLRVEEEGAMQTAMLAARADVEANVQIGED